MNILIRKVASSKFALMAAAFFLILATGAIASTATHAVNGDGMSSGHLVTIHDRGIEKVILSKATTVGDAIKQAGIPIDSKDLVEPSLNDKLIAYNYQVNIYRARPVLVIDGNIREKTITAYQTPEQIAGSAGITLYPEDKTTMDQVDNLSDGAGLQMTIKRAVPFEFTLYGKTTTVRTQAATVGEMLSEKGIKLTKDDRVLPASSAKIVNGLPVRVWREGKQTITSEEPVPFDVQKIQDADREVGYLSVTTAGENGARNVTYEIIVQDGKEVSRTEIASLTTKLPTTQVEIIGVKPKNFGGSCAEWMAAAGITDTGSASVLIDRESHCNPYSVNSGSGACGVGQAMPCGKTGCEMGDGACQMIWANEYVLGRYGSWAAALQHSNLYGWY